jgi:nicotinamide riboside kinase
MTTVALLLGGECTGKTALAQALAKEWVTQFPTSPASVVSEALRDFTSRSGRTPSLGEQPEIWRQQTQLLIEARQACPDGALVVCDPAPLMTAVYSVQYFDDDSLIPRALEATSPADVIVLCSPDIPWEPDGIQRDGPHARQRTHDLLEDLILPHLCNEVIVVSGSVDERVSQVLTRVT